MQEVEVEVESQKMAEHRQALENYSKAVEEQRNRLGQVRMILVSAPTRFYGKKNSVAVWRKGNPEETECAVAILQTKVPASPG